MAVNSNFPHRKRRLLQPGCGKFKLIRYLADILIDMIREAKFGFESIVCYVVIALIVFKLFSSGILVASEYMEKELYYTALSDGWEQVLEDGSRIPATVPGKAKKDNGQFTIETTLPSIITEHTWLSIRSTRQNVYIYIDDELRKSYHRDVEEYGRTTVPSFYLFVQLNEKDIGKTIRITCSSEYESLAYRINEIVIGNQMGIWYYYASRNYAGFVLPLIVLFIAVGTICVLVAVSIFNKNSRKFIVLGVGVFVFSSWEICDSHLRQLIFNNVSVAADVAYMLFALIPIPFLYCLDVLQKERYHKSNFFLSVLCLIDFVCTTFLNETGISAFIFSMPFIVLLAVISTIYIIVTIIVDIFRGHVVDNTITIAGYVGFSGFGIVGGILYVTDYDTTAIPIVNIGMIIIMVCAIVDMIHSYVIDRRDRLVAEQVSSAKSQFIASMSHEIRTPINAVLGMDELILRESNEEDISSYAKKIKDSGKSLLRLINEILDYSRLESGKFNIIEETYDAEISITSLYRIFEPIADKKGLSMELKEHGLKDRLLVGDSEKICKMIGEILTNAINYTEEGTISMKAFIVDINKVDETGHDLVMFSVVISDTGVGISHEDLKKLFDPFENTGEKDGQSGMSLVVVNKTLQAMGSKLNVRSRLGKGSVFSFDIVQKKANEKECALWKTKPIEPNMDVLMQKGRYCSGTLRVLCVDDSSMNLSVISGLLKRTGAYVKTTTSGQSAIDIAKGEPFDVIFMDHRMPGMDGQEAMSIIKAYYEKENQKVIVIALTGNEHEGARREYQNMGFDNYLSKPVKTFELEEMLWMYCEDKVTASPSSLLEADENDETIIKLKQIEFINIDSGIENCGGKELFINAVKTFTQTADDNLDIIKKAIEERNLKSGVIRVHALKSNARIIGSKDLSEHAAYLEGLGDEGREDEFFEGTNKLLEEYTDVVERLRTVLTDEENEDLQNEESLEEISNEELEDAYSAIEECAKSLDYDSIEEIIIELSKYRLSELDKKCIKLIRKGVVVADSSKIVEAITERTK